VEKAPKTQETARLARAGRFPWATTATTLGAVAVCAP